MSDRSRNGLWRMLRGLAASVLMLSLVALGAVSAPAGATAPPAWAIVSSPNAAGSISNDLTGTSCAGAFCVAVGSYSNGSLDQTLIETSSGSGWTVTPSPNPAGAQDSYLIGVSCTSPTFCVADGFFVDSSDANQTLVETWDGTSWSIGSSANAAGASFLEDVSCTSPSFCAAVGVYQTGGVSSVNQTLVETWDGTSWAVVTSPNTSSTQSNALDGVSCTSAQFCVAVGNYDDSTPAQTLVETWDGTSWSITPSPNSSTSEANYLDGVSCLSAASCQAVGTQVTGTVLVPLAESWNGAAWTIEPTPAPGSNGDELHSVSCTAPDSCVAVGNVGLLDPPAPGGVKAFAVPGHSGQTAHIPVAITTLVETWDGSAWSVTNSPITSAAVNSLQDVACNLANGCVAVGFSNAGTNDQTLIEAQPPAPSSYWLAAADGGVFAYPAGSFHGSHGGSHLNQPVVGIASTADGGGYWLAASDGGVFNYGDAGFYGSMGGTPLNKPVAGIAGDPATGGYWLVAADGGVFNFHAPLYGEAAGSVHLNAPIVGIAATPDGGGYWLVAADGGVFKYGDAGFYGSMGGTPLNKPVVGIAGDPATGGYWLVAADGGVFNFHAPFDGAAGSIRLNDPVVGMAAAPDGGGYWLAASDGGVFNYGDAGFTGSLGGTHLNAPVVGMAAS